MLIRSGIIAASGGGTGGDGGPGSDVATFVLTNSSNSVTSPGFMRVGVPFRKGDVPSGAALTISTGGSPVDAQFDERNAWSDGSLRFAVCHLRDATFSAAESRTYTITTALASSFNNSGSKSLSDITGTHDFKVAFSSVVQSNSAVPGSGSFTASFNSHAGVATRVTKVHSGPVCEGWMIWGMATDDVGGAEHAHLKTVWHVDIWKNSDGSIADVEYAAVVTQDWWAVANKFRLNYNAALKDGATVINSYASVAHPYHAQWATVRTANDDNHARRFWANAIPTLIYQPDKDYWISTNLVPPLDTTLTPESNSARGYTASYVPLSAENHRPNVDGTGAYAGRGAISNVDCIAFLRQTSQDYRYARTSAFAGLHVGYHHRTNQTRTRPGDGVADIANTAPSIKFRQLGAGDDFTSYGMPQKGHFYTLGTSGTNMTAESSETIPYASYAGGAGVWTLSNGTSHAVNYSYFMYLLEGERYFLDATLDLAVTATVKRNGNTNDGAPGYVYSQVAPFSTLLSIPSSTGSGGVQYSGIAGMKGSTNVRQVGWALNLINSARAVLPDSDVHSAFMKTYHRQQGQYLADNIPYMPAGQLAQGAWGVQTGWSYIDSPWMQAFIAMFMAQGAVMCEDSNLRTMTGYMQNGAVVGYDGTNNYLSSPYRLLRIPKPSQTYDPTTNAFIAASAEMEYTDGTVVSDVITSGSTVPPTNGDVIYFAPFTTNPAPLTMPTGITEGTPYYAVNCSGQAFQVAASPDGSPLPIDQTDVGIACRWQSLTASVMSYPPYLPLSSDNYSMILRAAAVMCHRAGASLMTDSKMDTIKTFTAPNDRTSWFTWWLV